MEDFFEVTNNGTTPVPLSAIQIKFWPDDTSGQKVVPQIFTGGCVSDAGNPSCVHQVSGVTATATPFSPACGPTSGQQANWEVTISNTDGAVLPPGATWSNLQGQLHLANYGNFSPGTADWYSSCAHGASNGGYTATGTFALYDSGQLVRSSTGVPPSCRAPSGTQQIAGNVPLAVATAPLVGALPGTTPLTVSIALPLQVNGVPGSGFPSLTTFIEEISSPTGSRPASLTPATFAGAYGPSVSSYTAVTNFATSNGLTVVSTLTARDLLTVTGTAAAVENAFFVTLNVYLRPDGTTFFAPANDPSVNLSVPLIGVLGLDNVSTVIPAGSSTLACPQSPFGNQMGLFGPDFKSAYFGGANGCLSTLEGEGQTVALLEVDSYLPLDVLAYAQGTALGASPLDVPGLNANPPALPNVKQELLGSATQLAYDALTFLPTGFSFTFGSTQEDVEVVLDIDMVLAMAPKVHLIVYEGGESQDANVYVRLLHQIADEDRAQVISTSLLWLPGTPVEQLCASNAFSQFAVQSQSFVVAAGDQGSLIAQDAYNSSIMGGEITIAEEPIIDSEYMTVVGGTELNVSGANTITAETTWNDTSRPRLFDFDSTNSSPNNSVTTGGFCTGSSPNSLGGPLPPSLSGPALSALPIPSWQINVNPGNKELNENPLQARMIPDVSLVADGIANVCGLDAGGCPTYNSTSAEQCVTGTSAAAPLWAGFLALVNEANGVGNSPSATPIGFANPTLYSLASAFNDIADGSNNNWFDNGQKSEIGGVPTIGQQVPALTVPYAISAQMGASTFEVPVSDSLLFGAADAGVSESPGLYHAVTGYDLATGLGTPTCALFSSLAPNFAPPGSDAGGGGDAADAAPGVVTITYHQVGECEGFPEVATDPQAGGGAAFVIFGIDSIVNTETTAFDFNPSNLFVPLSGFVLQNPSPLFPIPFLTSMTIGAGMNIQFMGAPMRNDAGLDAASPLPTQFVMAEFATAIQAGTAGFVQTSLFLSYSQVSGVAPVNGGSLAPNVVLVKSNSTAAETANLQVNGDCTMINLM